MTDGTGALSRRALLGSTGAAIATGLAGCSSLGSSTGGGSDAGSGTSGGADDTAGGGSGGSSTDWRTTELTAVRGDETFTVQQFEGQPVVLEFFAVWCPVCTRQQEQLGAAVENNDDLVAISLNVDPNEDAARVREHLQQHDFGWRYTIAPSSVTRSLIDQFGSVITNPPAAPVVRVCPGGSAALIDQRGVKSASDMESALQQC